MLNKSLQGTIVHNPYRALFLNMARLYWGGAFDVDAVRSQIIKLLQSTPGIMELCFFPRFGISAAQYSKHWNDYIVRGVG